MAAPYFRSLLGPALGLGVALAALGAPSVAQAQSVTVLPQSLDRKLGFRPQDQQPTWISYADCIGDDTFTFETTVANTSGYQLEVWVGSNVDCTPYEARYGASPTCWLVYSAVPASATPKVTLRVQDIIAQNKSTDASSGPNTGTSTDCDEASGPTEGTSITLYFLLVDGSGQPAQSLTSSNYQTKFDLIGPPAPTAVTAGIGEDQLIVSWEASVANDLLGYRLYCDPKPGAAAPASSPMGGIPVDGGADGAVPDSGADAASSGGAGGAGGAAGSAGVAGSGGAAGGGGAATGGSGGSSGNANCPSDALVVGERPDSAYQCGSVTGKLATEGKASGLVNGVGYAVAVAAVDSVGNSGPLSQVACGTPQPVDDFFELYRRAGGKGGGGFCALGAEPAPGAAAASLLALLALGVRRRRRP